MGHNKTDMKLIEDQTCRQATFSKLQGGLLRKAHELSVLCDADIGLIIFSRTGELFHYCNESKSMEQIIEKYEQAKGFKSSEQSDLQRVSEKPRTENILLEQSLNLLNCNELDSIKYEDLEELEQQLNCSINKVRAKKEQLLKMQLNNLSRNVEKMEMENIQLYHWIEEHQASSSSQQQATTIEANMLEEKQRQVLNEFPFLGEEQPFDLLQFVNEFPHYRPYFVQPMQAQPADHHNHHQAG